MSEHYFCRDCHQPWSRDPDKHLMRCRARALLLETPPLTQVEERRLESFGIVLREAPRRRNGARFATHREPVELDVTMRQKLLRSMTPSQLVAMLVDDLATVRLVVLRGLQRRGLARVIGGRNPFWAFTPLGRRLRSWLHADEDRKDIEHRRATEGEDGAA